MLTEGNASRARHGLGYAVVWDFDWSFINENSDTYVVEKLVPSLIPELKDLMKTKFKNKWTALMDHMVGRMMMDFGITLSQLNECLCSIPMFEENITALKLAHSAGAINFILSDANHHYISIILDHHNIASSFKAIETNLSYVEDEPPPPSVAPDQQGEGGGRVVLKRLRISPHQPADNPHMCALCPENLCKGNVLDQWREQYSFTKVLYVGDGGGDFCPALRLQAADVVLCRQNYPLHKKCMAAARSQQLESHSGSELAESAHHLAADMVQWSSGTDILSFFQDVFCN